MVGKSRADENGGERKASGREKRVEGKRSMEAKRKRAQNVKECRKGREEGDCNFAALQRNTALLATSFRMHAARAAWASPYVSGAASITIMLARQWYPG